MDVNDLRPYDQQRHSGGSCSSARSGAATFFMVVVLLLAGCTFEPTSVIVTEAPAVSVGGYIILGDEIQDGGSAEIEALVAPSKASTREFGSGCLGLSIAIAESDFPEAFREVKNRSRYDSSEPNSLNTYVIDQRFHIIVTGNVYEEGDSSQLTLFPSAPPLIGESADVDYFKARWCAEGIV